MQFTGAHTREVDPQTPYPIIDILPLQETLLKTNQYGGTMRLGSYGATVKRGTLVHQLYQERTNLSGEVLRRRKGEGGSPVEPSEVTTVYERHRHRYEVNPAYIPVLEKYGFIFSGYHQRSDGTMLMEFAELPNHPFFVATQAHPEFKK